METIWKYVMVVALALVFMANIMIAAGYPATEDGPSDKAVPRAGRQCPPLKPWQCGQGQ